MNLYSIFVHIHSGLRWLVLMSLLAAIVIAAVNRSKKQSSAPGGFNVNLWAMILMHFQLMFGIVLYFISEKVVFAASSMSSSVHRFYLLEHALMMIIAVVLVTLGYIKSKRTEEHGRKSRLILIYYGVALLFILLAIPWPFRELGGGWF